VTVALGHPSSASRGSQEPSGCPVLLHPSPAGCHRRLPPALDPNVARSTSPLDTRTPPVATQPPRPAPRVRVDLSAELPALLAGLVDRWGSVSRVTYNLDVWNPVERRLVVAGRIVRLGGFHSQHADTVTLIGASGQRLTLLVIPPASTPTAAHHALTTAARPGNDNPIETLLAPHTTSTDRTTSTDTAIQRWELDGGRTTERAPPPTSSWRGCRITDIPLPER
jgi:hypothetical protein